LFVLYSSVDLTVIGLKMNVDLEKKISPI